MGHLLGNCKKFMCERGVSLVCQRGEEGGALNLVLICYKDLREGRFLT